MKSKLVDELPELVKNQVISEEVALKIRGYYQSQQSDAPNKISFYESSKNAHFRITLLYPDQGY